MTGLLKRPLRDSEKDGCEKIDIVKYLQRHWCVNVFSIHKERDTYICAVLLSLLITSKLPPSVLFNHTGPADSTDGAVPAAWARLVPLLRKSSPLPPTTSLSWLNEVPVLVL